MLENCNKVTWTSALFQGVDLVNRAVTVSTCTLETGQDQGQPQKKEKKKEGQERKRTRTPSRSSVPKFHCRATRVKQKEVRSGVAEHSFRNMILDSATAGLVPQEDGRIDPVNSSKRVEIFSLQLQFLAASSRDWLLTFFSSKMQMTYLCLLQ